MVSLGVQPVAVPNDVKLQFSALVDWMPDSAEIAELEEFGESYPLNLEALALQEPDLIIAGDWEIDYYGEPFTQIAPVYSTLWGHNGDWRARFMRVADALDRTTEAQAVSDEFDALVASLPAEVTGQTIAFVRADALDNIRADTLETSFPASVAREAGIPVLDLSTEVDLDPEANWIDLSPERLDLLAGADLIVISDQSFYDPDRESTDVVLAGSPLWENLPAVQAGKVVLVPGPVYNGGSYQAASALITAIAETVTGG
jgi:iron complex transport system substrate-binding protein